MSPVKSCHNFIASARISHKGAIGNDIVNDFVALENVVGGRSVEVLNRKEKLLSIPARNKHELASIMLKTSSAVVSGRAEGMGGLLHQSYIFF
jgi:hypothetical protein